MRLFLLPLLACSIAQAQRPEPRHDAPNPEKLPTSVSLSRRQQSTEPCAEISFAWGSQRTNSTIIRVPAELAYECLQSVPVDVNGDLLEIQELKEYLQYQSTLAYLKAGVPGQIEPLDIIRSLDQIADGVRNGSYDSDYEVQFSIRALLDSAGDFHLYFTPDITNIFSFERGASESLISLSNDTLQLPQLFVKNDIVRQGNVGFTPSAVVSINGKNAPEYIESFSSGTNFHDADSRYNFALSNPATAAYSGSDTGFFAKSYVYDGPNTTFVFSQFMTSPTLWMASFFDAFCQGPSNIPQAPLTPTTVVTTPPQPSLTGYPTPQFILSGKVISSYDLNGPYNDTSVLVLPAFGPSNNTLSRNPTVGGFLEAQRMLRAFFTNALRQRKRKLIIDLRGNGGGTIDLGFELFKQLYPDVEPFGGSRYRAHEAFHLYSAALADQAENGTNLDGVQNSDSDSDADNSRSETFLWSNILDVNGKPYPSFADYYGPDTLQNDTFVSLRRYNFSRTPGGHTLNANLTGYGDQPSPPQPFTSENIVIIQDGYCGSTCAIFAELMREQGRVQSIAVGGRPNNKAMQGVGGTKGSQVLLFTDLLNFANTTVRISNALDGKLVTDTLIRSTAVGRILNTTQLLQRTAQPAEGQKLNGAVNPLNNYRQGDETETPLEFVYEAADCRLFYSRETYLNPVSLWTQAIEAKWGNGTCVPGSTGDKTAIGVINKTPFELKGRNSTNNSSTPANEGGASSSIAPVGFLTLAAVLAVSLAI